MNCPRWLRRRIEDRGFIPRWVHWIWPKAHWCPEMDDLLVVDRLDWEWNCYCDRKPKDPRCDSEADFSKMAKRAFRDADGDPGVPW